MIVDNGCPIELIEFTKPDQAEISRTPSKLKE
jgi:hypothetical protein